MKEINILKDVFEKYQVPRRLKKKCQQNEYKIFATKGKSYLGADIVSNETIYFALFEEICVVDDTLNVQVRLSAIKENEFDEIDRLYYVDSVQDFIPRLKLKIPY